MALGKVVFSLLLLVVIAAAGVWLLQGPLYSRYTAAECVDAYARARTHTDSAHVDLHPYAPANGSTLDHRCGEVRAVRADSAANLSLR